MRAEAVLGSTGAHDVAPVDVEVDVVVLEHPVDVDVELFAEIGRKSDD